MLADYQRASIWDKCLLELKDQIAESAYYTWFPNLEFQEISNSDFIIGTPNNFVLDYVSHHYREIIQKVIHSVVDKSLQLKFTNLDRSCTPVYKEETLQPDNLIEGHEDTPDSSQKLTASNSEANSEAQLKADLKTDLSDNLNANSNLFPNLSPNLSNKQSSNRSSSRNNNPFPKYYQTSFQDELTYTKNPTVIDSTIELNPKYNFDNFVVGDCNQFAHAACMAVSESPKNNNFNPLVLYGGTGMGKTHLLHAIAQFIKDTETAKKVVYRTSEEFTREYIEFVHKNKDSRSFYRVYQDADVLLIDDIQFLANKKNTQEEFFNIFNNLFQLNKQIIITSDRLPSEIDGLQSRLLSRFDTGLLANMQPPDLETRLAILKKKQNDSTGIFINEEILSYVANSVTSNVRELEGTLIKLSAFSSFTKMPITVQIAKQILGDTIRYSNKPINMKIILLEVSKNFNVPISHLTSQSRKQNVALPRHLAMYLARELTDNSLHTIGLTFGRDYSTVIHSVKKVKQLLSEDKELLKTVGTLKDNLARAAETVYTP